MHNPKQPQQLQHWSIPLSIFLLAFLPRVIRPISWPMQWYERSIRFGDAVLARDWAGTFQRHHPGVTTMWLSGIGLKVFAGARGVSSEQLLGAAPIQPGVISQAIVAGVIPLALVIALCITLSFVLLKRLLGRREAFVAACLLALDPIYVAYSQVLHVDALLATFMLVSALFLLNHLHQSKRGDLVMSGVFGGLALLSKSPALFLLPYVGLAVGASRMGGNASWRRWVVWLRKVARTVTVWVLVAGVVFVLLWPAMWVQPLDILNKMGQRIVAKVETPHYNPVFFNGRVHFTDPGPLFYLAEIGWKTTLVTLPAICVGIVFAVLRLRERKWNAALGLFVAYVFFFTTQMCLGARKELAYLLPAFPALDVVAACGIVWMANGVARIQRWLPSVVIGGILMLQAGLVLPRHPYYGTLHNRLLGGSWAAQHVLPLQDQGEGLDLAGQYLNGLPHAQRASAGVHQRGGAIFRRNFVGLATAIDDPRADYRVYFVNQVMRRLEIESWEALWEADQQIEPLWTATFGGATYVWIYGAPPEELAADGPEWKVDYRLGEHIQLERVRLSAEQLSPGETLTVVLYWRSDGAVERSYKVFCHVTSEGGELASQRDRVPLAGVRPTSSWRADEVLEDSYEIVLDADLSPGKYELSVGMYDVESMERLLVHDATGSRLPDDRILLGQVLIEADTDG
jgi:hypothetical protein